mgnify:CR=1 FL=1
MRQSMLTNEQTRLLTDEKDALSSVLLRLAEMDVPERSLAALHKATQQLDELFLIVVVGEFNSGKSALINALLGERVLAEGVTPTTSRVTLIKWGEEKSESVMDEGYAIVTYPLPLLKEVNIVDSPGTNAIIRQHERLTDEFVPRSDLVLFTTSADRPLTESERQFLQRILGWGKKVVFVLNKADIFEDQAALEEAQAYVLKYATLTLGEAPVLFPVSARLAQRSLAEADESTRQAMRAASRMDALEKYITTTLDDGSRLRLKFNNPLGVAENLIESAAAATHARAEELQADKVTADSLETALRAYQHDLQIELAPRLAEVENILHRLEMRGLDFFDRTLRLTNIHHLVRGDRIRANFEQEVLMDVSRQINEQVHSIIDWLVEKDLREWQQVMAYLQRRQTAHQDQVVDGGVGSPQAAQRRELMDKVGKRVNTIIEGYDRLKEASQLAANVEAAVAQTALFEAGAVGLGVLVSTALLSSALDITGIIAAGTLAIVGFFVIPYKRKQAKDNFRQKIVSLRANLNEALTAAFSSESANAIARLQNNITPYTRFVHAEEEHIRQAEARLEELRQGIAGLKARVEMLVK